MQSIEDLIVTELSEKKTTVSTAESCTGGLIAATIVNVSGASEVFEQGFITYANRAKMQILGVSVDTLDKYGAVSEETAREMAVGCAKVAKSDYAIVSTGIAGPNGGSKEKPVGLVFLGCFAKGTVKIEQHFFSGNRMEIRQQSVDSALKLLHHMICTTT